MKIASTLALAVASLLVASLDAAEVVGGSGIRGYRQDNRNLKGSKKGGSGSGNGASTSGTGFWNNGKPTNTATVTGINVVSNSGQTQTSTNPGSSTASRPSGGTGANGATATVTVNSNTHNNGGGRDSGDSNLGGSSVAGYNIGANNGQQGNAAVQFVQVTSSSGQVTYQAGSQVVQPSVGNTYTASTVGGKKKTSLKSKARRARRIYHPQDHPDLTEAYLGEITVNGKPVSPKSP